jgi:LPS sulfotransferase NodH
VKAAEMTSFLICASARTGTNLLATALRQTKISGSPHEYFNDDMMNEPFMLRLLGLTAASGGPPDFAARLGRILRAGTSPNGVFGATVHWWQLKNLMAAIEKPQELTAPQNRHPPDALRMFFPDLRFIWLRRENKVAQAISHYVAITTGRWYELNSNAMPERRSADGVPFDFAAIRHLVDTAEREESGWRRFLASMEDTTLPLTYEELAADFPGVITRVLGFLGLSLAPAEIPPPSFRRQADARSLAWERRYRKEARAAAAEGGGY